MQVTLKPEHEAFVRKQIERGKYHDADELIEQAIRLLEEHDKLISLRAAVTEARAEVARGDAAEWTPDLMDRLQREADEEDRLGLPISDNVTP